MKDESLLEAQVRTLPKSAVLLVAIVIGIVILAAAALAFRSLRSDATPLSQSLGRFVFAVAAIGSFGTAIHLMTTILSEAQRYAEGRDKFEELIGETAFDDVAYQMSNWAPGLFWCASTFAFSVWALARIRRNRRRASMPRP